VVGCTVTLEGTFDTDRGTELARMETGAVVVVVFAVGTSGGAEGVAVMAIGTGAEEDEGIEERAFKETALFLLEELEEEEEEVSIVDDTWAGGCDCVCCCCCCCCCLDCVCCCCCFCCCSRVLFVFIAVKEDCCNCIVDC